MSPEQLAGGTALDRRTDVYSLAASLYEALTLARPFEAPSRVELYRRIRAEPCPIRGSATRASRGRARRARDRARARPGAPLRDGLEFAEDLRRIREYEPIRARPAGVVAALLALDAQRTRARRLDHRDDRSRCPRASRSRSTCSRSATSALRLTRSDGTSRQRCLALIPEDPLLALTLGIQAADREIREAGAERGADYLTRSALFEALDACWLEQVVSRRRPSSRRTWT
jgi:serine/threonine protein kinase